MHLPQTATAADDSMFAPGKHVLLDFWQCTASQLIDSDAIELALREAAAACGATVLDVRLHSFGEGQGVTGVALLAESHISIHTWPETGFVALDVFMCGACDALAAVAPLRTAFQPAKFTKTLIERGDDAAANQQYRA